jgi:hypothetical protein
MVSPALPDIEPDKGAPDFKGLTYMHCTKMSSFIVQCITKKYVYSIESPQFPSPFISYKRNRNHG